MAALVYTLCALTSIASAGLLLRHYYSGTRHRLLFWSGWCFAGLALNNIMLLLDKIVYAGVDLSTWRLLPALIGMAFLVYGLVSTIDKG